jgi:hypothetical protein
MALQKTATEGVTKIKYRGSERQAQAAASNISDAGRFLDAWSLGRIGGAGPILLERNNVDLPLDVRHRVSERMRTIARPSGPCFNAPNVPALSHWSTDDYQLERGGCGPVWMAEGRSACCFPQEGSTIKIK